MLGNFNIVQEKLCLMVEHQARLKPVAKIRDFEFWQSNYTVLTKQQTAKQLTIKLFVVCICELSMFFHDMANMTCDMLLSNS